MLACVRCEEKKTISGVKCAYSRITSVIEWELSILPLSSSKESAADDLWALYRLALRSGRR